MITMIKSHTKPEETADDGVGFVCVLELDEQKKKN